MEILPATGRDNLQASQQHGGTLGAMTSMDDSRISSPITPVILAAGDSVRMGFPKALLPIGRDSFLTRILNTLDGLGLADPVVVLGRSAESVKPLLEQRPARIVVNPKPEEGQLSSFKLALLRLESSTPACLLWPVDQPGVSGSLVRSLNRLFYDSGAKIALPVCGERRGHPAIFARELFPEILEIPVGEGLKNLVTRYRKETACLETGELATIQDVDTPEDYFRLTGKRLEELP